jgi:hypothetical protein
MKTAAWVSTVILTLCTLQPACGEFKAGAAAVDITPQQFPVLVNGGMFNRSADSVKSRLFARAIVLDDGHVRLAIVVVDSCMMPRPLLDDTKQRAAAQTKIPANRMLISATHTHTAPASIGVLGTDPDLAYIPLLRRSLVQAIVRAEANLKPAQVGWAVSGAAQFTALRRWIRRPDRIEKDPFGNLTVRANMHAGSNWNDVTGESGPEDPSLSLISIQSTDGRPLALLANFSMHYYGDGSGLSSDYFGLFCHEVQARLSGTHGDADPPFVVAMSHGCSGDIWRRDYKSGSKVESDIASYARGLADIAAKACNGIEYETDLDVAMSETRLQLNYRVPDQQRLEWAQRIVESLGDRLPETTTEVYAREQLFLHERQSTEIVVQAVRIGDIGIATTPCETYALTGLKIKLQSPLEKTMVIELANGGDGYIPPPEQHLLGGYNTWPARSAGLEIQAEPIIVETGLRLLEKVVGQRRRRFRQTEGTAVKALLAASPVAYWRLDEFAGPRAIDLSGKNCDATYEPPIAFFLEGPGSEKFCAGGEVNRSAHFAGGRLRARVPDLKDQYSVAIWFYNGMPVDGRPITGWLFSRGSDHGFHADGDHLGLGGTLGHAGKLVLPGGSRPEDSGSDHATLLGGQTEVDRWSWNHVVFVRDGIDVRVYLNGHPQPEIETVLPADAQSDLDLLFFGGRSDRDSTWEGRLDEIAVFDRALTPQEVQALVD